MNAISSHFSEVCKYPLREASGGNQPHVMVTGLPVDFIQLDMGNDVDCYVVKKGFAEKAQYILLYIR